MDILWRSVQDSKMGKFSERSTKIYIYILFSFKLILRSLDKVLYGFFNIIKMAQKYSRFTTFTYNLTYVNDILSLITEVPNGFVYYIWIGMTSFAVRWGWISSKINYYLISLVYRSDYLLVLIWYYIFKVKFLQWAKFHCQTTLPCWPV